MANKLIVSLLLLLIILTVTTAMEFEAACEKVDIQKCKRETYTSWPGKSEQELCCQAWYLYDCLLVEAIQHCRDEQVQEAERINGLVLGGFESMWCPTLPYADAMKYCTRTGVHVVGVNKNALDRAEEEPEEGDIFP